MRNQNKYFMWLYDFVLDKCSRFRYKKRDKDFILFQNYDVSNHGKRKRFLA